MIAELRFEGFLIVYRLLDIGDCQTEREVLEWANHRPSGHPTQGATMAGFILTVFFGDFVERGALR